MNLDVYRLTDIMVLYSSFTRDIDGFMKFIRTEGGVILNAAGVWAPEQDFSPWFVDVANAIARAIHCSVSDVGFYIYIDFVFKFDMNIICATVIDSNHKLTGYAGSYLGGGQERKTSVSLPYDLSTRPGRGASDAYLERYLCVVVAYFVCVRFSLDAKPKMLHAAISGATPLVAWPCDRDSNWLDDSRIETRLLVSND